MLEVTVKASVKLILMTCSFTIMRTVGMCRTHQVHKYTAYSLPVHSAVWTSILSILLLRRMGHSQSSQASTETEQ